MKTSSDEERAKLQAKPHSEVPIADAAAEIRRLLKAVLSSRIASVKLLCHGGNREDWNELCRSVPLDVTELVALQKAFHLDHYDQVIDVRLNHISQLAGFFKKEDLEYFLEQIVGVSYVHLPMLAPTQDILDAYKKHQGDWSMYEQQFLELMRKREIEKRFGAFDDGWWMSPMQRGQTAPLPSSSRR